MENMHIEIDVKNFANHIIFVFFPEPLAPVVLSLTTRKDAESQTEIELWPAEQRNGPIR